MSDPPGKTFPCPRCASEQAPASRCRQCGFSFVVLGHWRLRELLGQGGMAPVYRVERDGEPVPAAAKLMRLGGGASWKSRELFERSAAVLAKLEHRALPTLHDFGQEEDGTLVMVRELFEGSNLHRRVVEEHWHPDGPTTTALLRELLEVLDYLHDRPRPIIHRDLKPSNIMFRDDLQPVLVDFDTVSGAAERSSTTIIVSPGYTAPEQLAGSVAPSADLYSLGATMLLVVSGKEPHDFERDRRGELELGDALRHTRGPLREVIEGLLRADPAARIPSAKAALELLDGRRAKHPALPARPAVAKAAASGAGPRTSPRVVVGVVGVGVMAVAVAVGFVLVRGGPEPPQIDSGPVAAAVASEEPVVAVEVPAAPPATPLPREAPAPEPECSACSPDQICREGECATVLAELLASEQGLRCRVTRDRQLECQSSSNRHGELGNGTEDTPGWVRPRGLGPVSLARSGRSQVCAVDEEGTPWCWGDNRYGFIPGQGGKSVPWPTQIEPPEDAAIIDIALAWGRPYFLSETGRLWTRRDGGKWQRVAKDIVAVDAESLWIAVVDAEGRVADWKQTPPKRLGRVAGLEQVRAVAVGGEHRCAVDEAGAVWCWGDNDKGQVAVEDPRHQAEPQRVELPGPARSVDAEGPRSCALLDDGRVLCWGQLATSTHVPQQVELPLGRQLVLAEARVCVLDEHQTERCSVLVHGR
jgi:hypothetical protein